MYMKYRTSCLELPQCPVVTKDLGSFYAITSPSAAVSAERRIAPRWCHQGCNLEPVQSTRQTYILSHLLGIYITTVLEPACRAPSKELCFSVLTGANLNSKS